ncbi:hypothetical protein C8R45DRAFT_1084432 [Mycena sanguinolenta]|nr:hypothetical protein C8R45DRAFT_1084432 [Mycena sanguinolenta]
MHLDIVLEDHSNPENQRPSSMDQVAGFQRFGPIRFFFEAPSSECARARPPRLIPADPRCKRPGSRDK